MKRIFARIIAAAMIAGPAVAPARSQGREPENRAVSLSLSYKADVIGVASGGVRRGVRVLDNADIVVDADLERAAGWQRLTAHASLLNNLGGRPNDLAGSIQGVDNIEVADHRMKLYEAWVEKGFGAQATLRTGLYDVNSEFYQNDAAGLLVSPMFGVGSELAATGTNGPAIFPSTALAARLKIDSGRRYAQVAIINARAGTIGDRDGIDLSGRDGALLIGEAGLVDGGKLAIGGWWYTDRQPAILPPGDAATDTRHLARGLYLLAERDLLGEAAGQGRHLVGFARFGLSDGRTSPFRGGWQVGVLLERPFRTRPAGAVSIGVGNGALSDRFRSRGPGDRPALNRSETIVEITYRDRIAEGLSVQPDLQYVLNPSADPRIDDALVLGVRFTFDWST